MLYKLLGMVVWKAARQYMRLRLGIARSGGDPSGRRKTLVAGGVAAAAVAAAVLGSRGSGE